MILDEDDKLFLHRIHSICRVDKSTILQVLEGILVTCDKEIYAGTDEVTIPGICKLKVDYHDKVEGNKGVLTEVILEAIPKKALISEINCISEGEETACEKKFKQEIKDRFKLTLGLEG